MTRVTFFTKDGNFFGFESKGHATGIDEYEEFVCNGISILTQSLYFSLLNLCGLLEENIDDHQEDGYLKITIVDDSYKRDDVKLLFNHTKLGLSLIAEQFPHNLEVLKLEVQND